jgi:predicted RNase H-like HicB family nuclease
MQDAVQSPDETLYITVEYHDGSADGDDGQPYYVASCDQLGLVTDGHTMDELLRNLRDAIDLAFEDDDPTKVYNVVAHPRLSIHMEMTDYAQIA